MTRSLQCALQAAVTRLGFAQLDMWDLMELFKERGWLMMSVPRFLWESFRICLKIALEQIVALLPRMMLRRQLSTPSHGGSAPALPLLRCSLLLSLPPGWHSTYVGEVIKAVGDLKHCSSHSLVMERKG